MNKKLLFIILSLTIGVSLSFSQKAYALFEPVEVFFKEIGPTNIIKGDVVHGDIEVNVSCGGIYDQVVEAQPRIDFDDGQIDHFESCKCEAPDASPPDTYISPKTVNCQIHFSHVYNASGTFSVMPSASWGGGGIGFGTGLGNIVSGQTEIITVVAPPKPGPATTTENPLATTTLSGLIDSISNFVVYIVTGLALLLVMVGGFYMVTSAGNPDQMSAGKKIIIYTIIGYVLIMVARGIINLIFKITGATISI